MTIDHFSIVGTITLGILVLMVMFAASLQLSGSARAQEPSSILSWAAFYHQGLTAADFDSYDLIILDSDTDISVRVLTNKDKIVLGYLSLAELHDQRRTFQGVQEKGIVVGKHPQWEGSHHIDVRDPQWARHIIEDIIPAILHRGFNGLFLDTIDSAIHLESTNGKAHKNMTDAIIRLIKAIRMHYPSIMIAQNRGFDILDHTASDIDFLLGESTLTTYDFDNKTYEHQSKENSRAAIEKMHLATYLNPQLTVLTLDYWPQDDEDTIRQLYQRHREEGFHPYVSTIALDALHPEPQ